MSSATLLALTSANGGIDKVLAVPGRHSMSGVKNINDRTVGNFAAGALVIAFAKSRSNFLRSAIFERTSSKCRAAIVLTSAQEAFPGPLRSNNARTSSGVNLSSRAADEAQPSHVVTVVAAITTARPAWLKHKPIRS